METHHSIKKKNAAHHSFTQFKRSTVMHSFKNLVRVFSAFAALAFATPILVGQNLTNAGTGTITNTGTIIVKGSFTPATQISIGGTVDYRNSGAQTIAAIDYANLTGSGGGTKTMGGSFTVSGQVSSDTSGTVVSTGSDTLTVSGATPFTTNSGTFLFTSGTVDYSGGGQSVYSDTYGTLQLSAAGNKTMAGDVTANTALNLNDGNLQISGNTLTIAGTIATTSGTLEGSGTSNVTFSGTGGATLPSVTNGLGTLLVNRTGATDTVKLGGSLTVATALTLTDGDLHVNSSQTLTLSSTVGATSGTLSSEADGTVDYAQGSNGQSVLAASYGNLTLSDFNKTLPASSMNIAGTFTPGAATGHTVTSNAIVFNGGSQDIPSFNGATGYNDLTTAGGAVTKTVTGNIVVGGAFVNGSDVTTNVQSNTLSITGTRSQGNSAATMQFGANNGLVFTTGTVEYNGAAQNITGDASLAYANLLLSGGGTKSILTGGANTVHTTANLTINSGITLDVAAAGFLFVDLDLTNNGTITNAGTITIGQ